MDIKNLIQDYLEHLEVEKARSFRTIESYKRYLEKFCNFSKATHPKDITQETASSFRIFLNRIVDEKGRPLKRNTQNYYIIALRNFLKYLAKKGIETLNAEKIELAKSDPQEINFLEEDELSRLLAAPKGENIKSLRDKAILETLFSTGLRVSELCNLNRDDINFKAGEFSVKGKGGKIRIVFLSDLAKEALRKYLDARKDVDEALFIRIKNRPSSGRGLRLTPRQIERIVKYYGMVAGIGKKVHPHLLRHGLGTDLLKSGADLRSVQAILGHSSISTTQIYTHYTNTQLKEIHKKYHRKSLKNAEQ